MLFKTYMGDSFEVTGLDVRKVAFILNIMMNPTNINIDDISNVLFDMRIGV